MQCPVLCTLELDHACSGKWFARPCVRARRPSAKPTTYGAIHAAGCGEDVPLDAAGGVDVRCQFTNLAPALRLAPLARPVSWLVAGSTPAPGGPESCWLPLDSQHSAEQVLQPGKKNCSCYEKGSYCSGDTRDSGLIPHKTSPHSLLSYDTTLRPWARFPFDSPQAPNCFAARC